MKLIFMLILSMPLSLLMATNVFGASYDKCMPGVYGRSDQNIVLLTPKKWIQAPDLGYLVLDGRYGGTSSDSSPVTCKKGVIFLQEGNERMTRLEKREFKLTQTMFSATGVELVGELIEPIGAAENSIPLVVMVHGSERTPAIGNTRAYMLAAQGMKVFAYDKRGTGQSGGLYTQNFELLADDAQAALTQAKHLTNGFFSRAGYFGQSQGGWVAPLAATRSDVDFVVVGFGLVASPIEEDRDQMLLEASRLGLSNAERFLIRKLSDATADVVNSHFSNGYEKLEALREDIKDMRWFHSLNGEYSGDMLRMSDNDLRRVGQAVFDNLELIWDYDSTKVLQQLEIPLLWTIAGEDRAAPIQGTVVALTKLKASGKPFDVYIFPNTDHGMYEFVETPDGSRQYTRVTEGYFRLLGDWIHADLDKQYGHAKALTP